MGQERSIRGDHHNDGPTLRVRAGALRERDVAGDFLAHRDPRNLELAAHPEVRLYEDADPIAPSRSVRIREEVPVPPLKS